MLAFVTGHVRLNSALAPATRLVLNELWTRGATDHQQS